MVDIDRAGTKLCTIATAPHLRPCLRGLLAGGKYFRVCAVSLETFLLYLRNRNISAVRSQVIWEVFLRVELPSIHLDLSRSEKGRDGSMATLFKFLSVELIKQNAYFD